MTQHTQLRRVSIPFFPPPLFCPGLQMISWFPPLWGQKAALVLHWFRWWSHLETTSLARLEIPHKLGTTKSTVSLTRHRCCWGCHSRPPACPAHREAECFPTAIYNPPPWSLHMDTTHYPNQQVWMPQHVVNQLSPGLTWKEIESVYKNHTFLLRIINLKRIKWKDGPCSWERRPNNVKISISPN